MAKPPKDTPSPKAGNTGNKKDPSAEKSPAKQDGASESSADLVTASEVVEASPSPENEPIQMALSLFDSRPEILKKPVQAIHMAIQRGVQTKIQRLAWNVMLKNMHDWHAKNPDKDTAMYDIPRKKLMELIDYTSPNRKHLKDALKQMQQMSVEWDLLKQDGDALWTSTVLLPTVGFDREKVYYSFAPVIKPMLLDSRIFAKLDMRILSSFRLDHSVALYEWCNRFRNNPSQRTNIMTWEEWRWAIYGKVEEGSTLTQYKIFKKNKLKPAMEEINTISDLKIELIELKEGGRSVKNLQFIVRERPIFDVNEEGREEKEDWDEKLKVIGLSSRDRAKVLSKYHLNIIEAHYTYTLTRASDPSKDKIKNLGKYFLHALEQGYANDQVKSESNQKEKSSEVLKEVKETLLDNRTREAGNMFKEMDKPDQEALVKEYNEQQEEKGLKVPPTESKRSTGVMVTFHAWLAKKTWGEPSAQEILEFAIKTGKISLNS